MKNKRIFAAIALMLVASLFAGCSKETIETTRETIAVIETTAKDSEETEATTKASEETEETNINEPVTLNVDASWRTYIRSVSEADALFGLRGDKLYVYADGIYYECTMGADGEVRREEVAEDLIEYVSRICNLSKDDILRCPILPEIDTSSVITFDDNVADGTYYGFTIGISADGTQLFAVVGDPVIITDDLLNSQDPDSRILDYNGTPIDLERAGFWGTCGDIRHPEDISYELVGDSDVHIIINERLVIIPITDDATVTDSVSVFYEVNLNPEDFGQTSLTRSDAWGLTTGAIGGFSTTTNGWYSASFVIEPMVVSGGQVTEIHLGMR